MSARKAKLTAEEKEKARAEAAAEKAYQALPDDPDFNEVHLARPKPNDMFPNWMTERLRFLSYSQAVPCAHCGKKRKKHWTLFMAFRVADMPNVDRGENPFILADSKVVYPPLTPVCTKHLMAPILPKIHPKTPEAAITRPAAT